MPPTWIATSLLLTALTLPLTAQTALEADTAVFGRLTPDAPRQSYTYTARAGDTVALELTSDDFDANLVVNDAAGAIVAANDNGGAACNARLVLGTGSPATYEVLAAASSPYGLGVFRLAIRRAPEPAPADTACRHFLGIAGVLQMGDVVQATLSPADLQFRDSTHFRRYALAIDSGETATLDLVSDEFDPYLLIERGRGELVSRSDDGAGGCNARIVFRAADAHPLLMVVNTAVPGQLGRFTLRASRGALPLKPRAPCREPALAVAHAAPAAAVREAAVPPPAARSASPGPRALIVGQVAPGAVTAQDDILQSDSTYAQAWVFEGRAGQTVTIELTSDEFDAFLYLDGPGIARPLQDDDSAGHCNARISTTLPATGTYTIIVNTAVRRSTGRFTLALAAGSKPPSLARCIRVQ